MFPAGDVQSVPVERSGQHLATVHGISYGRRRETDNLALGFDPGDLPGPHVAVLHANVGGQPGHDPYSPCSVDDLVRTGIHYWALGHVHTRQVLHEHPWVVYPGNLQGRHAQETGAHGALLVEIDDNGHSRAPEFVPLDRVRLDAVTVDIADVADLGALRDRLRAVGHAQLSEADGRSLMLRVRLEGRGELHDDLARPGAVAAVLADLREDETDQPPLLWWDRLDAATRGPRDIDAVSERNDFVADMIDEAHELQTERSEALNDEWESELPTDVALLLAGDEDEGHGELWREALELAVDLVDRPEV